MVGTILNSIAIIILAIAFIMHVVLSHGRQ